ncbi:hexamerin-like isoform X2 [Cotesia glomerata]|uniref:hexamerin-like isoform X2 n=1 Tax=Cotesia glomerata TaxID=32391 RepID=UPI001D012D08|nr:hexamerin-like isoform X2 [Cotesia glomerata]
MRIFLLLVALVATVAATPTPVRQYAADQDFLHKQQDVIHILEHITQEIPDQHIYNLGKTYDIEHSYGDYSEPHLVEYYVGLVKHGHVQPRGTPFSTSVSQLRQEVSLLTRMFLGAKNYSVFFKTAAWARIHVNEHQFIQAFITALLQHPETHGIIPPALYEILPQHYFDARVIHEAQNVRIYGMDNPLTEQTVVIPVNYTDYVPHGEHQLSYFTHDIGLALFHAYFSLAGYMIPEGYKGHGVEGETHHGYHIGRGSIYYYIHHQLMAHYNLQRLSHGLGPIEEIDYEHVQTPYHPHLYLTNGLQFAGRSHDITLTPYYADLVRNVYALEHRIVNAIDSGYVITPQQAFVSLFHSEGLNILGEIIEGTGKSINPRYYGSYQAVARQLLGNAPEFANIWEYTPAPLDLHETSVRDPVFYKLYKRVIKFFQRYQESLPAYQYNDLVIPGVTIEKIVFPDVNTYFDTQIVDIDNGIYQPVNKHEQENLKVKAEVKRLNHKPYEYQIFVNSDKPVSNAVVRVYIAPKYDYDGKLVDINHHRHYFVELDQFVYDLQEGKNVIVRDSHHAPHFSHDYPSVHHIKTYVDSAVRSQNPYYVTEPSQIFGFPARLSIPKGRYGGYPLQILAFISTPEHPVPHFGPVVPAQYRTYQKQHYHIFDDEHYEPYVQEHKHGQGLYEHVDVVPHYHEHGVYGQDDKHHYYYGHYLYHKYPQYYPFHYYEHPEHVYQGEEHQGIHHTEYSGQYQHHVPVGQTVPQGQYQGVYHHSGATYPYVAGGAKEYVHGVHPEVHHGLHQEIHDKIHQDIVGGIRQAVHPVYPDVHHEVQGDQPAGYDHYKHNVEYLKNYYHGKHISEVIGGVVSLDYKPLGYPLDRPLSPSAYYVPNMKVAYFSVYHHDGHDEHHHETYRSTY